MIIYTYEDLEAHGCVISTVATNAILEKKDDPVV